MLTTLEKDIRQNLKHNITVGLLDGSLFGVGAWLRILRHHPATLCRVDDNISFTDRSCPCHSFSRLATATVIHSELCLTLAKIQTQRGHDDHPRTRPVFGIRHRRVAASDHWHAGGSCHHFYFINLAGTRRRIHRQLMDYP